MLHISKNVTLTAANNAKLIVKTAAGKETKAFTIASGGALTLNGIHVTVNGTSAKDGTPYDGTAFDVQYGGSLTVQNGAVSLCYGSERMDAARKSV